MFFTYSDKSVCDKSKKIFLSLLDFDIQLSQPNLYFFSWYKRDPTWSEWDSSIDWVHALLTGDLT